MRTLVLLLVIITVLIIPIWSGTAASITPADFDPGATLIDFDSVSGYLDGSEFGAGLRLRSGPGVEPAENAVPADFVKIETEFPHAMASPPNKISGAQLVDGSIIGCKFCAIVIEFDQLQYQVGFWVTDPDNGQFAEFYGPGGLIAVETVAGANSDFPFFIGYEDAGGISRVEVHSVTWLGLGIDNLTFSAIPEPSTGLLLGLGLAALATRRRHIPR
jgi:hypothetical protein